jgi:hypothetical protein
MDWNAIGAVGEILGAIAVLITLIYLARQVKHGTKQAHLSSIQAVNASNDSAFEPIYIPENSKIFAKGQECFSSLDQHEKIVFDMLMTRLMASFSATTYQFDHGVYDEELYWGMVGFYASYIQSPGGAEWFREGKSRLSQSCVNNLETASSIAEN